MRHALDTGRNRCPLRGEEGTLYNDVRRIVKWWHRVSNDRVREITGVQPVDECVRLSRWKWL